MPLISNLESVLSNCACTRNSNSANYRDSMIRFDSPIWEEIKTMPNLISQEPKKINNTREKVIYDLDPIGILECWKSGILGLE